jgi:hypothetical protein
VPKPQQRLVEAWAEIHRAELQHDWELLQSGQPPVKIEPLSSTMSHPIHRVTRFTLLVGFSDGTEQRIDFKPVLHGPLFGPLQDSATFNSVRLDTEVGTLVWPNDADFDPATLHDWPDVRGELAARARTWDPLGGRPAGSPANGADAPLKGDGARLICNVMRRTPGPPRRHSGRSIITAASSMLA